MRSKKNPRQPEAFTYIPSVKKLRRKGTEKNEEQVILHGKLTKEEKALLRECTATKEGRDLVQRCGETNRQSARIETLRLLLRECANRCIFLHNIVVDMRKEEIKKYRRIIKEVNAKPSFRKLFKDMRMSRVRIRIEN